MSDDDFEGHNDDELFNENVDFSIEDSFRTILGGLSNNARKHEFEYEEADEEAVKVGNDKDLADSDDELVSNIGQMMKGLNTLSSTQMWT